ncbi:MAG: peptidoglycan editing factor PgeF [Limnospira sp.]
MHIWTWHEWQGLPYLTCSILSPWRHGFFSRQFSPRSPADLVEVLEPGIPAYRTKQVHGNEVLKTTQVSPLSSEEDTPLAEADGLLTHKPSESVWVASADCVPVLIGDGATGRVAAVHAGWRGTASKILPEAIAQFKQQGSQIPDLRVAMGPAISGSVYQVSKNVAVQLAATLLLTDTATSLSEILDPLYHLSNPPLLPDPEPDRARADVRRFNALQLERLGLGADQVAISSHCTYSQPELFFSYRRDRLKSVQWSGIVNSSPG